MLPLWRLQSLVAQYGDLFRPRPPSGSCGTLPPILPSRSFFPCDHRAAGKGGEALFLAGLFGRPLGVRSSSHAVRGRAGRGPGTRWAASCFAALGPPAGANPAYPIALFSPPWPPWGALAPAARAFSRRGVLGAAGFVARARCARGGRTVNAPVYGPRRYGNRLLPRLPGTSGLRTMERMCRYSSRLGSEARVVHGTAGAGGILQDGQRLIRQPVRYTAFALRRGALRRCGLHRAHSCPSTFSGFAAQRHPGCCSPCSPFGPASIGLRCRCACPSTSPLTASSSASAPTSASPGGVAPASSLAAPSSPCWAAAWWHGVGALQMGASIGSVLAALPLASCGAAAAPSRTAILPRSAWRRRSARCSSPLWAPAAVRVLELAPTARWRATAHVMLLATFVAYAIARAVGHRRPYPGGRAARAVVWGARRPPPARGFVPRRGRRGCSRAAARAAPMVRHRVGAARSSPSRRAACCLAALVLAFDWQAEAARWVWGLQAGRSAGEAAPGRLRCQGRALPCSCWASACWRRDYAHVHRRRAAGPGAEIFAAGQPAGFSAALGMAAFRGGQPLPAGGGACGRRDIRP